MKSLGVEVVYWDRQKSKSFHTSVPENVDIILDCVGPETIEMGLKCLNQGGKMVIIGNVALSQLKVLIFYCFLSFIAN